MVLHDQNRARHSNTLHTRNALNTFTNNLSMMVDALTTLADEAHASGLQAASDELLRARDCVADVWRGLLRSEASEGVSR